MLWEFRGMKLTLHDSCRNGFDYDWNPVGLHYKPFTVYVIDLISDY